MDTSTEETPPAEQCEARQAVLKLLRGAGACAWGSIYTSLGKLMSKARVIAIISKVSRRSSDRIVKSWLQPAGSLGGCKPGRRLALYGMGVRMLPSVDTSLKAV